MPQEPIAKARLELLSFLQRNMEEQGLSMKTLSERTGMSSAVLERVLSSEGSPTVDELLTLCLALGIGINLNAADTEQQEEEIPEVMLCEEPIHGSDIFLLHTRHPRSLWLCELVDDEEEIDADDTVQFKTFDGFQEQWAISPAVVYESSSDDELEKAMERCSHYLQAYLSWEDEDLRKAQADGMN
jgi:transcriptional regulator with XRE-family HTH domain